MLRSSVPVQSSRAIEAATMVWSVRGHLRVTVVAKATFAIVPGATMRLAAPLPIQTADVHTDGNPGRSVRAVSDLVPHLPAVDVTLVGEAHAPRGAPTTRLVARLALFRERVPLLDKSVEVLASEKGGSPVPFERMPLTYERALGGIGFQDNPLGRGAGGSGERPNLCDPRDPHRVACFAPISPAWPARKRLIRPEVRKGLERPIPELPGDFDWSYFHAAPTDQRIERLLGGEHLLLAGMHPAFAELHTRLPRFDAGARFSGHTEDPTEIHPVPLLADSLWIDAEAGRVTVTFRASVPVAREELLSRAQVSVALGLEGAPLEWPAAPYPLAETAPSQDASSGAPSFDRTVMLEEGSLPPTPRPQREATLVQTGRNAREQTLPFAPGERRGESSPPSPRLPIPGAPWGAPFGPLSSPFTADVASATFTQDLPVFVPEAAVLPEVAGPVPPARVERPHEELPPVPEPVFHAPAAAPSPAPSPASAPARDPYGQGAPWAAGPRESPVVLPAPPPPKAAPKPKADLYKKFGKR